MFAALFEAITVNLVGRLSNDLERRWWRLAQAIKRTSWGVLLLQVSGPFFVIGFGLLLTAMLLSLAKFGWVTACLWTAGASLVFALLIALIAGSFMRR